VAQPPFLGSGWRFPILPDASGALGWVAGDDNVEQSLQILLMTALGERVMRSDFGTRLPSLVFAPGSTQYLSLLETAVTEAVTNWEPRIDLNSVSAEADATDPFKVVVSISYTVRQTNTSNNLVFPYYLGSIQGP
jgi:phage baseplate assembly protein W